VRTSLHKKLTGAMLLVTTLDSVGYLIAVQYVDKANPSLIAALEDIFVAASLITISVGLVLPGVIAHTAGQVATAADRLARGTLTDFTRAMERFASGDLSHVAAPVDNRHVVVHSADELGAMAQSFNTMQDEVGRAARALGVARDELRGSRSELEKLAETDPLTGMSNRRHFEGELENEAALTVQLARSSALLVLDLDNFKYVNDSHGHAVGDSVLLQVARILRGRLRASDVVARLGGDEFAVLLRDVVPDRAATIARNLLDEVRAARFPLEDGHQLRLSVSIGITTFDGTDALSPAELLVNADIAMYDAKEAGRDRVAVAAADVHQERIKSRQSWLERIHVALEQDTMELHAQPILHLGSRQVTSYELLIRMRSDTGELIPPAAFLDIAERSGVIRDIDHWVIRSACRMIAEAHAVGESLQLEVNVSGVSISDPEFAALIEPHLIALGLLAQNLVIELTETAAVGNLANAIEFAKGLARHGCQFALDDFGAGFGGFYYLKYLPCQYLKIDGEFIRTLPSSPVDQVFVRAMVELAHGLGKQTIAEFVEDEETLQLLVELGIDYAQGYHIGRPAPLNPQLENAGRHSA
jgi:diguanylate cyclase (GGDEF)-like protein